MSSKVITGLGAALLIGSWAVVYRANNPPIANIGMIGVATGLLITVGGGLAWVL